MRLLITTLIALFIAVALGFFIKHDPGLVVIKYSGTTVQTPFSVFVLGLLLIVIALFFLVAFTRGLIRLPKGFQRWRKHRRYRHSEKFLSKAMLSMVEGNWKRAEDSFRKGAAFSANPMVNYLGAARAAQQLGILQRRDHYLRLAHDFSPDSTSAVSLTQAELQLSEKQTEQAYATLKLLDSEQPDLAQVKLMLLDASAELKDWKQVLELLEKVERKGLLPIEQVRAKQLNAYAGLLRQAGQASSRDKLDNEWNKIPKKLRQELYLLEVYIEERLWFPDTSDCEPLLRQCLKRNWDSNIVRLYGEVEGTEMDKQLAFAEKQLAAHANDPILLLTLGRLCKRNSLWGKARNYLEESLALAPTPEAYRELAVLLERQGEHNGAAICYQEGLEYATDRHRQSGVSMIDNKDKKQKRNTKLVEATLPVPRTQT